MSSGKWRPYCPGLNVLSVPEVNPKNMGKIKRYQNTTNQIKMRMQNIGVYTRIQGLYSLRRYSLIG